MDPREESTEASPVHVLSENVFVSTVGCVSTWRQRNGAFHYFGDFVRHVTKIAQLSISIPSWQPMKF